MSSPEVENSVGQAAVRMLGLDDPPQHPADLLGLGPDMEAWDAPSVSRALLDRLSRIDEHPQARTPEADELRVALHVAAAQLRDPAVRTSLSVPGTEEPAEASASQPDPLSAPGASEVGRAAAPAAVMVPASVRIDEDFKIAAQHVLASCGGWNAESKRRLGYLARSASVDAGGLQQALVAITRQHEQPSRSQNAPLHQPLSSPAQPDEDSGSPLSRTGSRTRRPLDHRISSPRARTWLTIGTAIMLVASLVIGMGLITIVVQELLEPPRQIQTRVISGTNGQPASAGGPAPPGSADNGEDQDAQPAGVSAPPITADGPGLIRYLQSLTSEAFADATEESLAGFENVYAQIAATWTAFDPDILATAPLAFRDAVLAASDVEDSIALRAMQPLLVDLEPLDPDSRSLEPSAITRSVFAYGTLSLFEGAAIPPMAERELRTRLNSIASVVTGGVTGQRGFEPRADVALRVLAIKLVPRASEKIDQRLIAAWDAWIEMAGRYGPSDGTALVLDGIESVLREGESPSSHRPTAEVIKLLVRSVDWEADTDRIASTRLMEWFDAPDTVSDGVISLVTGELVDAALLPGLDASMKLSTGGTAQDRRSLRDQYALRLSHPQIGEGAQFASEWAGYAEGLLEEGIPSDPRGALDRAVRAARMNEAAALWLSSDEAGARSVLDQSRIGLEELTASAGGPVSFGRGATPRADGEWAAKYLLARRNADERNRLLYELENTGGPAGEADADVLAEAASYSTPMEVRRQAQAIVVAYSDREWVLIGLLEVLPRAAEHDNVSEMLSAATGRTLPSVDDQDWRTEARKALVARLLEIMVDPDQRFLDVAGEVLERSLRARAELLPISDTQTAPSGLDAIEQSMVTSDSGSLNPVDIAADYADRLTHAAARYPQRAILFATLPELESRRLWRLRLVDSDTGMFAAQTTTVLELIAYIFGSERPSEAAAVNSIIEESASMRRDAGSVYEQIAINEIAMLRINLLRLRGGR